MRCSSTACPFPATDGSPIWGWVAGPTRRGHVMRWNGQGNAAGERDAESSVQAAVDARARRAVQLAIMVKSGAAAHRGTCWSRTPATAPMLDRLDHRWVRDPSTLRWLPSLRGGATDELRFHGEDIARGPDHPAPVGWSPCPMNGGSSGSVAAASTRILLWRDCKPGVEPVGTGEALIFGLGPLTGTHTPHQWPPRRRPARARLPASTSSPALAGIGVSHAKLAGYDHIVIHGAAGQRPLTSGCMTIWWSSAMRQPLWGRDVRQSDAMIKTGARAMIRSGSAIVSARAGRIW